VGEAARFDKAAAGFADSAIVLDAYYLPTRYADVGANLDYTKERVEDAIEWASVMVAWLGEQIEHRLMGGDES
jgi:HEPN domain-containing protein